MKRKILVLGPGCTKCKTTYENVVKAITELGIDAEIIKIEDMEEMMQYDVLTTPVLMIDGVAHIKGRVAQTDEIIKLLNQ